MSGITFFFVLLGVAVLVGEFMALVEWLDTPRAARRRLPRRATREDPDRSAAELALERARLAA